MTTNTNPTTGIAFGYIRLDAVDQHYQDIIWNTARNLTYEESRDEYIAVKRLAHIEQYGNADSFNEDRHETKHGDQYHAEEEIYEGKLDGVSFRTSWLGGAPHLWVFESPVVTLCRPCSPCVPGAGDLNSTGAYRAYGVPAEWLEAGFLQEKCKDFKFVQLAADECYWQALNDHNIRGKTCETAEEALIDCYKTHHQGTL